jgi:hypothetical protein
VTGHLFFVVMGAGFFVFGCAIGGPTTYFAVNRYRNRERALERVATVEATITTAELERFRDRDSVRSKYRYRPKVRFRYEYDGRTHESDRRAYDALFTTTESRSAAERTLGRYPEGESVSAYVDPANPSNGFLEIDDSGQFLTTLVLVLIGGFSLVAALTGGGMVLLAVAFG